MKVGSLCMLTGGSLQLYRLDGKFHGPELRPGEMFLFMGQVGTLTLECNDCLYKGERYFYPVGYMYEIKCVSS